MQVALLLLLVPRLVLPFIRRKWSLSLTYVIYVGLEAFLVINIWLQVTNGLYISKGLAWISAAFAAVCLAIIFVANHLYRIANPKS
jgi:hypothetical protein